MKYKPSNHISTWSEKSLHHNLKTWIAQPGDILETLVGDFIVDILRGDMIIEIQTANFSAIKPKLFQLIQHHQVHLVYPIPQVRWIVKIDSNGNVVRSRRKSPKHGRVEHLFTQLIRIPEFPLSDNFSLEVLLTQEEEIQVNDGQGSWRRKGWSIQDRRLLGVVEQHTFMCLDEYLTLLPPGLPIHFTTHDLSSHLGIPQSLAQKMAYCLHKMTLLQRTGKKGKSYLYRRSDEKERSKQ